MSSSHPTTTTATTASSSPSLSFSTSPTSVTLLDPKSHNMIPPIALSKTKVEDDRVERRREDRALITSSSSSATSSSSSSSSSSSFSWDVVPASSKANRTRNPIRAVVDPIVADIRTGQQRGDGKDHISLALGDPTAGGNLPCCPVAMDALQQTLKHNDADAVAAAGAGYIPALGLPEARQAIASYHTSSLTKSSRSVSSDNVIIANGCSGALELALTALLDEDSILLVPQPGFPLYQVIAESHGATVIHYRLVPNRNWECDLSHIEEILENYGGTTSQRVRGIVINNPGNPTGAVFTYQHLVDIIQLCDRYHLPIIADEIYGDLTYGHDNVYYPLADVAADYGSTVPVITASGIGKQFLLPGWRVGWIIFHDNIYGSLREVEEGAKRLAQVILGASHLAQLVVPKLLCQDDVTIQQWKRNLRTTLEEQLDFVSTRLASIPGLQVYPAGGAMYSMVRIDPTHFENHDDNGTQITNDVEFCKRLLEEENVFVLPGSCFGVPNVVRVVFCASIDTLKEATDRIRTFCQRHQKHQKQLLQDQDGDQDLTYSDSSSYLPFDDDHSDLCE